MELKDPEKHRSPTEVGEGDFVKVGRRWKRIASNTAAGQARTPPDFTVTTEDGRRYTKYGVERYAKSEDFK